MRVCKICECELDLDEFPICSKIDDKVYRTRTCKKCTYKAKKESGKYEAYYKKYPQAWREYQKEYARVNYYDFYKKREENGK